MDDGKAVTRSVRLYHFLIVFKDGREVKLPDATMIIDQMQTVTITNIDGPLEVQVSELLRLDMGGVTIIRANQPA